MGRVDNGIIVIKPFLFVADRDSKSVAFTINILQSSMEQHALKMLRIVVIPTFTFT
jgi:hypothetical protein